MNQSAEPAEEGPLFESEGGSVQTAERNGQYLLIINQVALLDMLDESDREGIEAIREIVFRTAAERDVYIRERGWRGEGS
jgi:hypothetical protein